VFVYCYEVVAAVRFWNARYARLEQLCSICMLTKYLSSSCFKFWYGVCAF